MKDKIKFIYIIIILIFIKKITIFYKKLIINICNNIFLIIFKFF